MKRCPNCDFLNEERLPTCSVCFTPLVDEPTIPAEDPLHEEHEQRLLQQERHHRERRQLWSAALIYGLVITGLAAFPGGVTRMEFLTLFFGSALLTAFFVVKGWAGLFWSGILQGGMSIALFMQAGAFHPFVFMAIPMHLMLAPLLHYWVELIYTQHW